MIDNAKAGRVLSFVKLLKNPKGGSIKHRPFIQWLKWQEDFFRDIFATVKLDGRRQYREAFVEVPRKNGKTTTIAAAALYQLFASDEYGQEIYSAANDREQASLVFNMAASMIRANPALKKRCRIYDSTKRIVRMDTESFYKALSRDSATAHGLNPSFVIYDELHEAKSRDLYDVLKTGMGTRSEPLFVTITTAGTDQMGICYELYRYAKQVREGVIDDPAFYPLIFEAEEGDDIYDEAVWRKANPSAGAFRDLEEIRAYATRAKQLPTLEISFRRLYLNQWVQDLTRWMRMENWNACKRDILPDELLGRSCYAGLDLSSTNDISALVLVFPLDNGTFAILPFFWVPESKIDVRRKTGAILRPWIDAGYIEATPGEVVDYNFILHRLAELKNLYDIREIAFDRWGAAKLRADIEDIGLELVQFGQGFGSMSPPMKELERLIISKLLAYDDNPPMNWMASNVIARVDPAGNIKPDKEKSPEKIDGIVALIMGLDRAIRWRSEFSVYEMGDVKMIEME